METIFWAYITTNKSGHDRREYFEQEKSLKDFHEWLKHWTNKITEQQGTEAIVQNMGIIEKKI